MCWFCKSISEMGIQAKTQPQDTLRKEKMTGVTFFANQLQLISQQQLLF